MERVLATHHVGDHRLDVVEFVDDDSATMRLVIDGELPAPDVELGRVPTAEMAASLLDCWRRGRAVGNPPQMPDCGGLSVAEVIALLEAIDDEHLAHATYAQVLTDFGDVRPFSNIVDAEARHIDALATVMHRYGVPVPANAWPGRVPRYSSVTDACAAGLQAEIDNAELYDRLMAATSRPDIVEMFRNLREASQERHLPAFRRCAERSGEGRGMGRIGGGRGHRFRSA